MCVDNAQAHRCLNVFPSCLPANLMLHMAGNFGGNLFWQIREIWHLAEFTWAVGEAHVIMIFITIWLIQTGRFRLLFIL